MASLRQSIAVCLGVSLIIAVAACSSGSGDQTESGPSGSGAERVDDERRLHANVWWNGGAGPARPRQSLRGERRTRFAAPFFSSS